MFGISTFVLIYFERNILLYIYCIYIYSSTIIFIISNIDNKSAWMISEGSCDTEDWSNSWWKHRFT